MKGFAEKMQFSYNDKTKIAIQANVRLQAYQLTASDKIYTDLKSD
jgi:hypothetical protein